MGDKVKDGGGEHTNSTQAGKATDAYDFLAYNNATHVSTQDTTDTDHAYTALCHLTRTSVNARTLTNNANTFIMHLDSGTNYHMLGDITIFLERFEGTSVPIKFDNGQYLTSQPRGLVRLTKEVILTGLA